MKRVRDNFTSCKLLNVLHTPRTSFAFTNILLPRVTLTESFVGLGILFWFVILYFERLKIIRFSLSIPNLSLNTYVGLTHIVWTTFVSNSSFGQSKQLSCSMLRVIEKIKECYTLILSNLYFVCCVLILVEPRFSFHTKHFHFAQWLTNDVTHLNAFIIEIFQGSRKSCKIKSAILYGWYTNIPIIANL